MRLRQLISDHESQLAQTEEGKAKLSKRQKGKRAAAIVAKVAAVAFVIAFAVIALNNHFGWWEPMPW